MEHTAGYVIANTIFYSDRDSQYTSKEFANTARLLDVRLPVGRTGVRWDNVVAEYIEVDYNRRRRHCAILYRIPTVVMGEFKAQ